MRISTEINSAAMLIGLDNGITCNWSHAPFPTDLPQVCSYLKRAIECTAEAGDKIIDFDAIVKALKQVGYAGELTLKVDQYLKTHYPKDVSAGLKIMAATARKMAAVLE